MVTANQRVENKKLRRPDYALYIYAFSGPAWHIPDRRERTRDGESVG
jgi:hypothetical protein